MLSVRLFGELELRLGDDAPSPLGSARAESLLAYLIVHRDAPQPRQRVAFMLWPDSSEPQARTNLRHVLHNLRRALPDPERFLEIGPRTLRWRPDAPCRLDVAAFDAALARDDLPAAVGLYAGDLLTGGYDAWLQEPREALRERFLDALERLAAAPAGLNHAERLVREDPLREPAYRRLMELHAARGDRARALRTYHACVEALERELGALPSPETRAAYEALLGEDHVGPRGPTAAALVGRARELGRLCEIWRAAEAGRAQLVLVSGEPGIGKTRLLEELRAWCAQRGAITAESRSYAAEGALAYAPVAAWLRAGPIAARRGRVGAAHLAELARVLPEIGHHPAPSLPAHEQRRRLFDALGAALRVCAPLLLIADDLQWADRETLAFVHYVIRGASATPLLVAASARREELDPGAPLDVLLTALRTLGRGEEIELSRLSRTDTATLADRPLAPALADRLFAETEGNPLFALEALRAGWERPGLSPRVQAVIEARLGQLSAPARVLAGVASAIGREFTADVLAAATGADVVGPLDELWRRRIVRERGADAYDFTHDRIREVAYATLSPPRRRDAHARIAAALEARGTGDPGELAAHHDRAGEPGPAVVWYARAAEAAQALGAYNEAVRLLERALALEQDRAGELSLLLAQLPALAIAEGFGAGALVAAQERALALAAELGAEPAPQLLRSVALAALSRDDFALSRRIGAQLRMRGERDGDAVLLVESDYVLGISAFWDGELVAAAERFAAAVAACRTEHRPTHLARYGLDPEVVCRSRLANALALLGRPDEAREACERAVAVAVAIGHTPSSVTVHVFAALLALDLGDEDEVRRHAAALEPLLRDVKAAESPALALAGYLDVLAGRRAGLARIERADDPERTAGDAPGQRACIGRVRLEACAAAGDADAGLAAADRMLRLRVRLWHAEAHRLRARFLTAPGDRAAAERAAAAASERRSAGTLAERRVLDAPGQ